MYSSTSIRCVQLFDLATRCDATAALPHRLESLELLGEHFSQVGENYIDIMYVINFHMVTVQC